MVLKNRCETERQIKMFKMPSSIAFNDVSCSWFLLSVKGEDVCAKRKCPKFKVCVKNIQGLAICACPSEFICRRTNPNKNGEATSVEICGTDGNTYTSRCHLKIANCNSYRRIKRHHDGPCIDTISDSRITLYGNEGEVGNHKKNNNKSNNGDSKQGVKYRKKNRKNGNRKGRKDRKKKRHRKDKADRRESTRRRRSKRMNKRNKDHSKVVVGKRSSYVRKIPVWSESQIRKSKI